MNAETKTLTLHCCECGTEIDESQMFEFGGTVACEKCVRNYYKNRPTRDVELELQTRRQNAADWVRRNRRNLEKRVPIR